MELEQLIEEVKKDLAERHDIDKVVTDYENWGYCSPEQAAQLREHFAPSDIPDIVLPPLPSDSTISKPAPKNSLPERSVPVLHIDWGREIQPDVILSPNFTIHGDSLDHPPLVFFPIDERISQDGWKWDEVPKLERTPNGWRFHQELELKKPGQYRFQIVVIDTSPGYSDPGYYRSSFRMDVVDPKSAGQRPTVKIIAEEHALTNLGPLNPNVNYEITGKYVTAMMPDGSTNANSQAEPTSIAAWTMTVSFQTIADSSKRVPYVSQPKVPAVSRLTMTESSGKKCYQLISGRRLTFGRDVPEQNIRNDVLLAVLPGTPEEQDHAAEFFHLNGLFSREHARLEVHREGVEIVDVRTGGIQNATILDNQSLGKGTGALMFFHEDDSAKQRIVLFSKMLAMQFKPHREKLCDDTLQRNLPEPLPPELLTGLYALESSTGVSAICITPEQYFKQKTCAEPLLKILQKTPLPESDWWKRWFDKTNNVDPRYGTHEFWFIPLVVTLGRDHRSTIRLEHRHWNDIRLRVLCIGNSLFVENISLDTAVEFGVGEDYRPLAPFRPQPLCSGCFVRKGDAVLRFE
jgi:hypothetical protein